MTNALPNKGRAFSFALSSSFALSFALGDGVRPDRFPIVDIRTSTLLTASLSQQQASCPGLARRSFRDNLAFEVGLDNDRAVQFCTDRLTSKRILVSPNFVLKIQSSLAKYLMAESISALL